MAENPAAVGGVDHLTGIWPKGKSENCLRPSTQAYDKLQEEDGVFQGLPIPEAKGLASAARQDRMG